MPECVRLYLLRTRVRSLRILLHTRLRVQRHPAFPAPSDFEGEQDAKLGQIVPRERGIVSFTTSLRGAKATKQSTLQQVEKWIASRSLSSGRAFARTRWLAMTGSAV